VSKIRFLYETNYKTPFSVTDIHPSSKKVTQILTNIYSYLTEFHLLKLYLKYVRENSIDKSYSFILLWFHFYDCVYGLCCVCFLFIFVNSKFLLLCCWRILIAIYVLFCVFCFIVLLCVLFVCKYVLYYCHRLSIQWQLTNISHHNLTYHTIYCL
jgi:hypothetical protein